MYEPEEPDASLPELPRELSPEEAAESKEDDPDDASLKELLHEDSNELESALEEADESHGVIVVVVVTVVIAHSPSMID
jgi:hypothetical protein